MAEGGIRASYSINPNWIRDTIRLMLYTIKGRKKHSHTKAETSFKYQIPDSFDTEITTSRKPVDFRSRWNYSKHF